MLCLRYREGINKIVTLPSLVEQYDFFFPLQFFSEVNSV